MRRSLAPAALLGLLLFAATAHAQDDACAQRDPCSWFVQVDALGFVDEPAGGWNFTAGDWFTLTVLNLDDEAHRVGVDGLVSVDVPSETVADSAAFRWPDPGRYTLRDEPSGDAATVTVLDLDVVAITDTQGAGEEDTPVPGAVLLAGALAAAAIAARRH
jgi:hypothetical protein